MKATLLAAGILLGWLNASLAQAPGTKIWDYSFGTGFSVDTPALGPDGTIYVNGGGSLYALDANGQGLRATLRDPGRQDYWRRAESRKLKAEMGDRRTEDGRGKS
jgi:hypothetical protein